MVANLLTIGNAVCGFVAIILIGRASQAGDAACTDLKHAAWLILFGMVFDALDGRVARSTGTTSALGAQLDSLSDLVTFGVAPAVLVFHTQHLFSFSFWAKHQWILWCLCAAYFLGAVLRLARFNVENEPDESAHLCFKGLPTPGAAGVIASTMVFFCYIQDFKQRELINYFDQWKDSIQNAAHYIPMALPFLAGFLGYTMVSNSLHYVHVAGRFLSRRTFDAFAYVIFGIIAILFVPEITLPLLFLIYLLSAPIQFVVAKLSRRKRHSVDDPEQQP